MSRAEEEEEESHGQLIGNYSKIGAVVVAARAALRPKLRRKFSHRGAQYRVKRIFGYYKVICLGVEPRVLQYHDIDILLYAKQLAENGAMLRSL